MAPRLRPSAPRHLRPHPKRGRVVSPGRAIKQIAEAFSGIRIDQGKVLAELVAIREQMEAANRAARRLGEDGRPLNLNPQVLGRRVTVSTEALQRMKDDGERVPDVSS